MKSRLNKLKDDYERQQQFKKEKQRKLMSQLEMLEKRRPTLPQSKPRDRQATISYLPRTAATTDDAIKEVTLTRHDTLTKQDK